MTFRFENQGATPVYLLEQCSLAFQVAACADGYQQSLALQGTCTINCEDASDGGGCIACGECMSQTLEVLPGQAKDVSWSGLQYTFDHYQGCQCHYEHVAPAGLYRVSVPVWDKYFDPMQGEQPSASKQAQAYFELPGSGTVVISIGD